MKQYFNSKSKIRFIGVRHSEKLHETLVSHEEMINSKETKNYIKIEADVRGLNYDNYTDKGSNKNLKPAYSSKTSKKMNDKEIISLLDEIKNDYDSNE
jgi:UDP-glucose 4-epimerase